jgi:hypothetical protein
MANDLGLLAEEYDPSGKHLLGNFPQAFSHVSLINTAHNLSREPTTSQLRPNPPKTPTSPKNGAPGPMTGPRSPRRASPRAPARAFDRFQLD